MGFYAALCGCVALLDMCLAKEITPDHCNYGIETLTSTTVNASDTSYDLMFDFSVTASAYSWTRNEYTWSTVGTVMVMVDEGQNTTSTTTITESGLDDGGSLYSRTDVNSEGTVTAVVQDCHSNNITLTYPTGYLYVGDSISFAAILPTTKKNGEMCCDLATTTRAAPQHTPVVTPTMTVDSTDSKGWLYEIDTRSEFWRNQITALWPDQDVRAWYTGCPTTACAPFEWSMACGVESAQAYASIYATTTVVLSAPAKRTEGPAL